MASVRQLTKPNRAGKKPWVVEYTDQEGKRRRVTPKGGLKTDAEKIRKQIEKCGSPAGPHIRITVEALCEIYIRRQEIDVRSGARSVGAHEKDISAYERFIRPKIGKVVVGRLGPGDVQNWIDNLSLRDRAKPRNIRNAFNFLRSALLEGQRLGYIVKNVAKEVPPRLPSVVQPDPIAVPNEAQVARLIAKSEGQFSLILRIAAITGMRIGEICALQWDCIDFETNTIRVQRSFCVKTRTLKRPKTRAGVRDIPLPPALKDALLAYKCKQHTKRSLFRKALKFVFADDYDRPIWRDKYIREWNALLSSCGFLDQAGRPLFRFHSLRHFAASSMIHADLPPKRIQYIMGHVSIQMTFDRYGRLFDDRGASRNALAQVEQRFITQGEA